MRILFTGASSLTGMWFVQELAKAGHEVVAIFRANQEDYTELRKLRVEAVIPYCEPIFNCSFGSSRFFDLINSDQAWDLFCHHAADVTDYKSPLFDPIAALKNNTYHFDKVIEELKKKGCQKIALTGSVFEPNEGEGSDNLRAVSPYGLSKGLTSEYIRCFSLLADCRLGKFVIPNPFGPYEEVRYTTYLIQSWYEGKIADVRFPDYVRDNIPVQLLAKAYLNFIESLPADPGYQKINPSYYVESQGDFTKRFSHEMRRRLDLPCEYTLHTQTQFTEPKIRINTDRITLSWNEEEGWNELAAYYQNQYQTVTL